jgi:hypothetical protein
VIFQSGEERNSFIAEVMFPGSDERISTKSFSRFASYRNICDEIGEETIPFFTFMQNHIRESSTTVLMRDPNDETCTTNTDVVPLGQGFIRRNRRELQIKLKPVAGDLLS